MAVCDRSCGVNTDKKARQIAGTTNRLLPVILKLI